jgi:hypothetical protein
MCGVVYRANAWPPMLQRRPASYKASLSVASLLVNSTLLFTRLTREDIESQVRVAQVSKSMQYTGDILEVLPIPFYAYVDVFVATLHLTYQTPCIA